MWLLIDAGNTRIKWATIEVQAHDEHTADNGLPRWQQFQAIAHNEIAQLATQWQALKVDAVFVSNVAGAAVKATLAAQLQAALPTISVHWFAASADCAGVHNAYQQPAQLGCDRYASAIAAHAMYPQHAVLVVTSGTATTIDAVSPDGVFQGGMILPGLMLMAQSLAKNTAQLPQVGNPTLRTAVFATNTQDAIVSGCIHAQLGAISLAYRTLQQQHGAQAFCILSGGGAPYLTASLDIPHRHVENMVLTGLLQVAKTI